MSTLKRCGWMLGILAAGFVLGRVDWSGLRIARAQEPAAGPSEEAMKKIQTAHDALKIAAEALKNESLYVPATKSLNVFGLLSGGLNAVDDLEAGRGVDPETFAALYADEGTDDVKQHLGRDEDGRLTYKNKVVRIYPISRLKRAYGQRLIMSGEVKAPPKAP